MSSKCVSLKIGIIGVGRVGALHLRNLLQMPGKFEAVAVADDCPCAEAVELLSHYPSVKLLSTKQIGKLLDTCDVIAIASPSATHEQYIRRALQKGRHVFCEKPLVEKVEAIKALYDLGKFSKTDHFSRASKLCFYSANEKGLKILCGMSRRFDDAALRARQEVQQGNLGRLRKMSIISRDNPPPTKEYLKHAPTIYMDMAIHDVDMAIWLINERPSLVKFFF